MRLLEKRSSPLSVDCRRVAQGIYRKTVVILGQKQSGKTWFILNLLKVLPKPVIAVDMVGRLIEYAESQNLDSFLLEVDGWNQDVWNTIQKALRKRENLIIYCGNMTQQEKSDFMDSLSRALAEYHKFTLIVDEIHEVLPQNRGIYAQDFDRFIRTCGNRQIGIVFSTQRPAIVNKDILALADEYVVFRIVYSGDLKVLGHLLQYHLRTREEIEAHLRRIQGFQTGEHQMYGFVRTRR